MLNRLCNPWEGINYRCEFIITEPVEQPYVTRVTIVKYNLDKFIEEINVEAGENRDYINRVITLSQLEYFLKKKNAVLYTELDSSYHMFRREREQCLNHCFYRFLSMIGNLSTQKAIQNKQEGA